MVARFKASRQYCNLIDVEPGTLYVFRFPDDRVWVLRMAKIDESVRYPFVVNRFLRGQVVTALYFRRRITITTVLAHCFNYSTKFLDICQSSRLILELARVILRIRQVENRSAIEVALCFVVFVE